MTEIPEHLLRRAQRARDAGRGEPEPTEPTEPAPDRRNAALIALVEGLEPLIEAAAGFRAKCLGLGLGEAAADAAAGELLVQSVRHTFNRSNPNPPSLMDLLRGKRG